MNAAIFLMEVIQTFLLPAVILSIYFMERPRLNPLRGVFDDSDFERDELWRKNAQEAQLLVGELARELHPVVDDLEEQLDRDWDRFDEHSKEMDRVFSCDSQAFATTEFAEPTAYLEALRKLRSDWSVLMTPPSSSKFKKVG